MKITKRQWIIGGAVALVLAGGGIGIALDNQAQAQAEKMAQDAKTAHDNLIKEAKDSTEKAETFKVESDVTMAQNAIEKLDEKDKTALIPRVEKVRQNWDLVHKADKAVANTEKVQNDANVKTAQTAIDKIKAEMAKPKKIALQKRLDKVKVSIKNTKKQKQMTSQKGLHQEKEEVAKKVESSSQPESANNSEATQAQTETQMATDPAPTENGGASNNNAYQPTPQAPAGGNNAGNGNTSTPNPPSTGGGNTGTPPTGGGSGNEGGNTGNGGGNTTPPPATTFTGWVRRNGVIVWSQGGFKTLDEAGRAAAAWANAHMDFDGDWSSGAY